MNALTRRESTADRTPGRPVSRELHTEIDLGELSDVYIVGDVHGCIDELRALLRQLQSTPKDLVLFTGDLIRKGPASTRVLDLIRRRDNFRSVRGNNEQKVIDDGVATALPSWARLYIETLPLTIGFADALIVHGGVDPREPIHDQPPETLLALRSVTPGNGYDGPFWFDRYRGPPCVFFSHTVLEDPLVGWHTVGLDTGCVDGGELSAYDFREDTVVSVSAHRAYLSRADERIHTPA